MWTTASVFLRWEVYVVGLRMSPLAQVTDLDHCGGLGEDVTEDQEGSPERLNTLAVGLEALDSVWSPY